MTPSPCDASDLFCPRRFDAADLSLMPFFDVLRDAVLICLPDDDDVADFRCVLFACCFYFLIFDHFHFLCLLLRFSLFSYDAS